jgi:hypothetical protein
MEKEREKLITLIKSYILSDIGFEDFYSRYSKVYLNEDENLTENEIFDEAFEEIFDKSDWVSLEKEIDGESRSYGYIYPEEFKIWLIEYLINSALRVR